MDVSEKYKTLLAKKAESDSKVSVAKALLDRAKTQETEDRNAIKARWNVTPEELKRMVEEARPKVEAKLLEIETQLQTL